ncbi:MAG: winged helix-turn-helix transcriptional regulator [Thermodesulfobacteriota bacterium]|nr:winged helix-turn-helix transcriptional regulator [Thermodesulfobacteriota bacterium]
MEKKSLTTLHILKEIEADNQVSQRELSKRLSISLGLVNQFMKRLLKKGYFKITTLPPSRARYLLTPKGFTEKSRLTLEYMKYSLRFYSNMKVLIRSQLEHIVSKGISSVILYGTGEVAELTYLFLQETPLELIGVISDKPDQASFYGLPILPINKIEKLGKGAILITDLDQPEQTKTRLENDVGNDRKVFILRS